MFSIKTLLINTEDMTMDELVECMKGFRNNKASGLDGIPTEVWKINALNEQLLEVRNKTFNSDRPNI